MKQNNIYFYRIITYELLHISIFTLIYVIFIEIINISRIIYNCIQKNSYVKIFLLLTNLF